MRGASRGDPEVEQPGRRGGDSPRTTAAPEPEGNLRSRGARGGVRTLAPGGPGGPTAPTTRGCLQWLHVSEMKAGENPLDADRTARFDTLSRKSGSRDTKRRKWSAGWRARFAKRASAQKADSTLLSAVRRSIPSLSRGASHVNERQRDEGLPGADQRARAMAHARTIRR